MTSLIRLADVAASTPVRPIEPTPIRDPAREGIERPQTREMGLNSNELEIRKLREALAAADKKAEQLVAAAREQGRKEALEAAVRDEAKARAVLENGVAKAVADVRDKLGSLEGLALAVAETALAGVFANTTDYRQQVTNAIVRQLQQVRRETVTSIRVSPADFSDTAGLTELGRAVGRGDLQVGHDKALKQGECRIDLRLGAIELSIPDYWDALKAKLSELGRNGGGAR